MESSSHRKGAFFGRRKGHPLRARQAELFETLLPQLALDLTAPPGELRSLFPRPLMRYGSKSALAAASILMARGSSASGYRIHRDRAFRQRNGEDARGHRGARADQYPASSRRCDDVVAWLQPATLARVDLLYPDPWPKRRHWKRRFVQDDSVGSLARILRPAANSASPAIFPTTWPGHLRAAAAIARLRRGRPSAPTIGGSLGPVSPGRATRPRRKREGRVPCYLIFRRI